MFDLYFDYMHASKSKQYYMYVVLRTISIVNDLLEIAKLFPARKTRARQSHKLKPTKHKKSPIRKIKFPQKFRVTRHPLDSPWCRASLHHRNDRSPGRMIHLCLGERNLQAREKRNWPVLKLLTLIGQVKWNPSEMSKRCHSKIVLSGNGLRQR